MSGIYIKGVELPKRCGLCGWYSLPDNGCRIDREASIIKIEDALSGRPDWCPIVEVPDHGRLIDADAFIVKQTERICENCDRRRGMKDGKLTARFVYKIGEAPCRACDTGDMIDYVDDAPVVIPADKEADDGET